MLLNPLLAPDLRPKPLPHDGNPTVDGGAYILGGDLLELKHAGPGQHRPKNGKEGVLGGGGDQGNPPVLHELQQGLLLLLVKILNLVQVEQHPLRGQEVPMSAMMSLMSEMEAVVALSRWRGRLVLWAMIFATVVFPVPEGP